ncbi:hypothetical protein L3556_09725 [Candidatus Synechococcus calcipolaris G9]|uniref:DUF3102 domain-containing protein n=1 Tax=Candidatus Synechococcus calcipolaris G9 TaxID=1497997 RepID=A0ABT6F053_9SYNE|nr:hypothetical protein [Candidatus Synechococcus calcipolaris]MDG2991205.1 hypothetical protein [Candidatus Synechococcus calcipolaris G9]
MTHSLVDSISSQTDSDADLRLSLGGDFPLDLPHPEDTQVSEEVFLTKVEQAWQVCERFDLQTEIWRGRILRTVRDREKHQGAHQGTGFLAWLQDQDISKTRAYSLIELANRADQLITDTDLPAEAIDRFSKRAFMETAAADPQVQTLITDAAQQGDRITYREVKQLQDEWTALHSDLLPEVIREKASDRSLSPRYIAPFVKELEKLPAEHQRHLQAEIVNSPNVDTLKQVTAEARYLARYLESAPQVQALQGSAVNLEQALGEAQRLGQLQTAADLIHQAAQLEGAIARLHGLWKRVGQLSEQLYVESGASTPHLQRLLESLDLLSGDLLQIELGSEEHRQSIRLHVLEGDTGNHGPA